MIYTVRKPRPSPEHVVDLMLWRRDGALDPHRTPGARREVSIGRTNRGRLEFLVLTGPKRSTVHVSFVLTRTQVVKLRTYLGAQLPRLSRER